MRRSKIDFFLPLILVLASIISASSKQSYPRPKCTDIVCKTDFEKMRQNGMKSCTECSDCFGDGYSFCTKNKSPNTECFCHIQLMPECVLANSTDIVTGGHTYQYQTCYAWVTKTPPAPEVKMRDGEPVVTFQALIGNDYWNAFNVVDSLVYFEYLTTKGVNCTDLKPPSLDVLTRINAGKPKSELDRQKPLKVCRESYQFPVRPKNDTDESQISSDIEPIDDDYESYSDEDLEDEESGEDFENPSPEPPIQELAFPLNYFDEFDAIEIFYQLTVNQSRQLKFRGNKPEPIKKLANITSAKKTFSLKGAKEEASNEDENLATEFDADETKLSDSITPKTTKQPAQPTESTTDKPIVYANDKNVDGKPILIEATSTAHLDRTRAHTPDSLPTVELEDSKKPEPNRPEDVQKGNEPLDENMAVYILGGIIVIALLLVVLALCLCRKRCCPPENGQSGMQLKTPTKNSGGKQYQRAPV